jgi:hypothetical protein
MPRPWGHTSTYHAWPSSTPVIDVVATLVAVASVVIGAHAALFLAFALRSGDKATAAENALFFVAIGLANASVDVLRCWRRHHG